MGGGEAGALAVQIWGLYWMGGLGILGWALVIGGLGRDFDILLCGVRGWYDVWMRKGHFRHRERLMVMSEDGGDWRGGGYFGCAGDVRC